MNSTDRKKLLNLINERRQKLADVSKELKDHFFGLDGIIDKIMQNIEVWYLMPELVTRPIIVNLWGMTGVGKTDLVRRLVNGLDFSDRFVEIQLTNNGSADSNSEYSNYFSSLQVILSGSDLEPKQPGILLLDEMQRFRSVDESGSEIFDYKFQDIWALLSDGSFSRDPGNKKKMLEMLLENLYYQDYDDNEEDDEDGAIAVSDSKRPIRPEQKKKKKHNKYHNPYYSAKSIKRILGLDAGIEEIMMYDRQKTNLLILEKMKDKSSFQGQDFTKLLIFISGNLDEAYDMSHECDEIDKDADIFHKFSLDINLLTVKDVLKLRFKPEQIARLGNVHVIYPSLSEKTYRSIIKRKSNDLIDNVKKRFGIKIAVGNDILDLIYRNGVFPAQGTRPLFSTISSILDNSFPYFILTAIENNVNLFSLYYDNLNICSEINGLIHKFKYEGDIDYIKRTGDNKDKKMLVSVHEAGHCLVYAKLLGIAPPQINIRTALKASGFVASHKTNDSRHNKLEHISIGLAGQCAEKLVFGENLVSAGSEKDIEIVTNCAARYVRHQGLGNRASRIIVKESQDRGVNVCNNSSAATDDFIENLIIERKEVTIEILYNYKQLLIDIAKTLFEFGKISPDKFKDICQEHRLSIKVVGVENVLYDNYSESFNKFCETENVPNKTNIALPGLSITTDRMSFNDAIACIKDHRDKIASMNYNFNDILNNFSDRPDLLEKLRKLIEEKEKNDK